MIAKETNTKDLKFYSQRAIGLATFIGGPAAAGYLIRENYLSLNQPEQGKKALIIGVIATIVLFALIFSIPEHIMNNVPNSIIPIAYTACIYFLVEKIHGDILTKHKEVGNDFHSAWKAAGVGIIALAVMFIGIFGYAYLETAGPEYEAYDAQLEVFYKNENETLTFYNDLNTKTDTELLREVITNSIPKWNENIAIIKKSNTIENLPSELLEQNKLLLNYAELRLKAFELFKKAIGENTDAYVNEIEQVHEEIDKTIDELNKL